MQRGKNYDNINKNVRTPSAIAWPIPNFGTFLAHSGLKWSVKQILPPRYIFAVLPSNSGSAISGAVAGYVIGICVIEWLCYLICTHWAAHAIDFKPKFPLKLHQIPLWIHISASCERTSMSQTIWYLLCSIPGETNRCLRLCYSAHTVNIESHLYDINKGFINRASSIEKLNEYDWILL